MTKPATQDDLLMFVSGLESRLQRLEGMLDTLLGEVTARRSYWQAPAINTDDKPKTDGEQA